MSIYQKYNFLHLSLKKFFLLKCILFLSINAIDSQILSSSFNNRAGIDFSNGNWYKIKINKDNVYKLDYQFFRKTLSISEELNFNKIGLYGIGGGMMKEDNSLHTNFELPQKSIKIFDANSNNILEPEDYILFYVNGPIKWEDNKDLMIHTSAYYTDYQCLFINIDKSNRLEIQKASKPSNINSITTNFTTFIASDSDIINPHNSGRLWYSNPLKYNSSKLIKFPNTKTELGSKIKCNINFYSDITSGTLDIFANNELIKSLALSHSKINFDEIIDFIASNDSIEIRLETNSISEGGFYLNYIRLNIDQSINFNSESKIFSNSSTFGTSSAVEGKIQSNSQDFEIWDITDETTPLIIPNTNNSFYFDNNNFKKFIIFSANNCPLPESIGKMKNQSIKSLPEAYNTIIYNTKWKEEATKIADFHKKIRGINTNIIDIDELYNEFSSGNKDPMAIRKMMMYFYYNNIVQKPKTLLLFGDASVDYKNILGSSVDYIPTYETLFSESAELSYCTDDFFGLLDSSETVLNSTSNLDIGIGRLPINSKKEANDMYLKLVSYKDSLSFGDWRNNTILVTDDVDNSFDTSFFKQSETIYSRLKDTMKTSTIIEKIYFDAFHQETFSGGQRYNDAEKLIKDKMTFGNLLTTYIGHGGPLNWSQERVLSLKDIKQYKNIHKLPFITTATCNFATYDQPNGQYSAGEQFLLQNDGGAIAMMTTSRELFIGDAEFFMNKFVNEFYKTENNEARDFGGIARNTKNSNNLSVNSQKIVLLADPAIQLNIPRYKIKTTSISSENKDTLKALSKVNIKGKIVDDNLKTINSFNGEIFVSIYDKKILTKLLNNDKTFDNSFNDTFLTETNRIFKGRAKVNKGVFSIEFIVPKDINYSLGYGEISYYAFDISSEPYRDANGLDNKVLIGGGNLLADKDIIAPEVNIFMNNDKFASGGITDANPVFLANIFDQSGINTSSNNIGHNIEIIFDNNDRTPINLNNYYISEQDNYQKGTISYPFYNLTPGKHTIKFRIWDTYNNLTEKTLEFIVVNDENISINKILNYPNPFTTNTYFQFEHNKPNEELNVVINIMTVSGIVVKSLNSKIFTDGYRVDKQIAWNGLDNMGDKIARGTYIYQIMVTDSKGNTAQKYEKLVKL